MGKNGPFERRVHNRKTVGDDSLCLIETPQATYLNINDCVAPHTEVLQRDCAKIPKVDVLLTQFSFANWAGNPGELPLCASRHNRS
jgi:UDP-MurNAc hydroxylase